MDLTRQQAHIYKIGQFILADPEYTNSEWDCLSIVVSLSASRQNATGYTYVAASHEARTSSETFAFFDL